MDKVNIVLGMFDMEAVQARKKNEITAIADDDISRGDETAPLKNKL